MDQNQPGGSFFPSSQVLITGGTFTSNVAYSQNASRFGYERLMNAVAPNALHDSGHVFDPPKCHPGTRVKVIQTILNWMDGKLEETREKWITWLSGAAGAGKSAIGRTVCERCAENRALLASFFFGSSDSSRNHAGSLVATIAYQICSISPAIRDVVCAFIEHDPLIFKRSLRTQFLSLVVDPLSAIYANEPQKVPRLIVIDGLDECSDPASQRDILESLLYVINTSRVDIRVLVCSRPESQISSSFDAVRMAPVVFKIYLDDEYFPDEDIELYLRDRFAEIRQSHTLRSLIPATWPKEEEIHQIVYKSSGQFIFAATVVRYVESKRHRPHQRLEAALGIRPPFKDLPFAELDALYTHIIMMTGEPTITIDILVFATLYGSGNMPLSDIEAILDLEAGDAHVVLADLAAIVKITPNYAGHGVTLLHKSFEDFLFNPDRSKSLYRNQIETRASHIIRIINLFSAYISREADQRGDFQLTNFYGMTLHTDVSDICYEDWSNSTKRVIQDTVTDFPLNSLFEAIFSPRNEGDPKRGYNKDHWFFNYFFSTLWIMEEHTDIKTIVDHCIQSFCAHAISEFFSTFSDYWEMNYAIATIMYPVHRLICWTDTNAFGSMINYLPIRYKAAIGDTLRHLLDNEGSQRILSRAASSCLEYLCDIARTRKEAHIHLKARWIDREKRRMRPWRWHMRSVSRVFEKRKVLSDEKYLRRPSISTYGKVTKRNCNQYYFRIFSGNFFDWLQTECGRHSGRKHDWYRYLAALENMCRYLPLAARYTPLIDLCKTKTFAPMSMMFPTLSRRARRKMAEYLERMEATVDGTQGSDNRV